MSFWRYCEKVSVSVGIELTLDYIHLVRKYWVQNKSVGEAVDALHGLCDG
jgi:hypothetical protein